jgi:hypothetical protein
MGAESTRCVSAHCHHARMWPGHQPFIGSEALAAEKLSRHELRRYYRAIMPNVYIDKRLQPSLRQRTVGAWLWSGRNAVIAGAAASAVHGSKWVDENVPVELIWRNGRPRRAWSPAMSCYRRANFNVATAFT